MSLAVSRPSDPLSAWPATSEHVDRAIRQLPPVDLDTLESQAGLLTRVDRKYVVPAWKLDRLVASLDEHWRALEIAGARTFGYSSTYFDTDDLLTYRAHLQGRRRRFKVRVRRYVESGDCMLEVKHKGLRGATVKERTPHHPVPGRLELGVSGRAFLAGVLAGRAELPSAPLRPVITTTNRRATLVSVVTRARLTLDTDLTCGWGDARATLRPGFVLVESKGNGLGSLVDQMLRRLGERPVSISKYCIGVAALGLDIPSNPWRHAVRRYFEMPRPEEEPCPPSVSSSQPSCSVASPPSPRVAPQSPPAPSRSPRSTTASAAPT